MHTFLECVLDCFTHLLLNINGPQEFTSLISYNLDHPIPTLWYVRVPTKIVEPCIEDFCAHLLARLIILLMIIPLELIMSLSSSPRSTLISSSIIFIVSYITLLISLSCFLGNLVNNSIWSIPKSTKLFIQTFSLWYLSSKIIMN